MYFIDKLHVYQDYPDGNLPRVGEELISRYSIEDGDLLRETVNPKRIEGSYTTKFSVRCDGTRVSVEANPSKWNRIDNLFGFQTFDDCIKLYNIELLKFGLPPFSKATNVSYQQTSKDGIYKRITNGASFREIDITRNLSVGKNNEHHFLRGLSSQCIGKGIMPHLYPDGMTLAWKTSIWYSKLYNKANEMQLPRYRKLIKKLNQEELDYRNKIINYCNDVGLIRDEKEFKQSFLNRNNLCDYGLVSEKDFLPYLTDIDNLLNKIEISTMEYEHISDILLERGICKSRQSANSTQSYVFAWLYGQPITKNSQFYVHQARLDQLGINLRKPYDVTKLMPQLRSNKEITVSTLSPPGWYKMPSVKNLKLVP